MWSCLQGAHGTWWLLVPHRQLNFNPGKGRFAGTSPESLAEGVGMGALKNGRVSTVEMGENVILGNGNSVRQGTEQVMRVVPAVNSGHDYSIRCMGQATRGRKGSKYGFYLKGLEGIIVGRQ